MIDILLQTFFHNRGIVVLSMLWYI